MSWASEHLNAERQFQVIRETEQRDRDGNVMATSVVSVPERRPHERLPNAAVARRSSLLDAENNIIQQWVIEKPELLAQRETIVEWAKELAAEMPRAAPLPLPPGRMSMPHLMACYPVGDHHLGMLAWSKETGASYDLDISEALLTNAMQHLIAVAPPCAEAAVVFLGDFMHYDSFDAVTPTSRNLLDADGRFPKLVRAAIRTTRRTIEAALSRHEAVRVIVEIGNHDLSSSIFLMEALANIYENEPRVTVDTSPKHFHYFDFGKCLIGTHHGHGVKLGQLPLIMAADEPERWGASQYRYWWTGHVHHHSAQDFAGCTVESFRVLPPTDAWAANKGYRSHRDMKAIVLHREYGEVARHTVNPLMVERQ